MACCLWYLCECVFSYGLFFFFFLFLFYSLSFSLSFSVLHYSNLTSPLPRHQLLFPILAKSFVSFVVCNRRPTINVFSFGFYHLVAVCVCLCFMFFKTKTIIPVVNVCVCVARCCLKFILDSNSQMFSLQRSLSE